MRIFLKRGLKFSFLPSACVLCPFLILGLSAPASEAVIAVTPAPTLQSSILASKVVFPSKRYTGAEDFLYSTPKSPTDSVHSQFTPLTLHGLSGRSRPEGNSGGPPAFNQSETNLEGDEADLSKKPRLQWLPLLQKGKLFGFPSRAEALSILEEWIARYPTFIRKFKAGESVEGRELWAYTIGDRTAAEVPLPPGLKAETAQSSLERPIWDYPPVLSSNGTCTRSSLPISQTADPTDFSTDDEKLVQSRPSLPRTLITALHHAREPASLSVVLYFVGRLLESAHGTWEDSRRAAFPAENVLKSRPDIEKAVSQYILSNRQLVVLPFVNPDGYEAIERTKNQEIRKNQRKTCPFSSNPMDNGVDINRNYGYVFKKDHDGCDTQEYEGPNAFSEPETQTMKCLVESFGFQSALNFHAYGGIWTRPFNCCNETELSDDAEGVFEELQKALNLTELDRAPRIGVLMYAATGEADDWMYAEHGVISMSPEVGDEKWGFWPPSHVINTINEEQYWRIVTVVMKSGFELTAHLKVPQISSTSSTINQTLSIDLFNSGLSPSPDGLLAVSIWHTTTTTKSNNATDGAAVSAPERLSESGYKPHVWPPVAPLDEEATVGALLHEKSSSSVVRVPSTASRKSAHLTINMRRQSSGSLIFCVLQPSTKLPLKKLRELLVCHCAFFPVANSQTASPLTMRQSSDPLCAASRSLAGVGGTEDFQVHPSGSPNKSKRPNLPTYHSALPSASNRATSVPAVNSKSREVLLLAWGYGTGAPRNKFILQFLAVLQMCIAIIGASAWGCLYVSEHPALVGTRLSQTARRCVHTVRIGLCCFPCLRKYLQRQSDREDGSDRSRRRTHYERQFVFQEDDEMEEQHRLSAMSGGW